MIYETPLAKYETDKKDKGQTTDDKGWRTLDFGPGGKVQALKGLTAMTPQ